MPAKSPSERKDCRSSGFIRTFARHHIAPPQCTFCPSFLECAREGDNFPVYRDRWGGVALMGRVEIEGPLGRDWSTRFLLLARSQACMTTVRDINDYLVVMEPESSPGVPIFVHRHVVAALDEPLTAYASNWISGEADICYQAVIKLRDAISERQKAMRSSEAKPPEKPESKSENRKAKIEKPKSESENRKARAEKLIIANIPERRSLLRPGDPGYGELSPPPRRITKAGWEIRGRGGIARSEPRKAKPEKAKPRPAALNTPFPAQRLSDKWKARFLSLARTVAGWSKDPSTGVGAVLFRPDKTIAAVGYNGLPRGVADHPERLENRSLKYSGTIHAEMNAILSSKDPDLRGYGLAVWPLAPCDRCMAHIIQAGILYIVFPDTAPDHQVSLRWAEKTGRAQAMLKEVGGIIETVAREEVKNA